MYNKCQMCGRVEPYSCATDKAEIKIGYFRRDYWLCDNCGRKLAEIVERTVLGKEVDNGGVATK